MSHEGFTYWTQTTAATLLAESVRPAADARVLLIGGGAALAVALGRQFPRGTLALIETDYRAFSATQRALADESIANAQPCPNFTVLPAQATTFDVVAVEMPKDRQLARRWLVEARAALRPGGQVYLAGANDAGIRAIIGDAEALFGNAALLAYRQHNRVARAIRAAGEPDPETAAWARQPGIAPGTWHEFTLNVRGQSFRLRSLPGIFAYDRLDDGTALLLEHLDVRGGARVLDVGCGYGIVGLVAARLGASEVDMVDSNLLAIAAARENSAGNDLPGARAFPSDLFSAVGNARYDLIVSNPPFHAGKGIDYQVGQALVERARDFLLPGGQLVLVANRFIRYDQQMQGRFAQVTRLAETSRYHVLAASDPVSPPAAARGRRGH